MSRSEYMDELLGVFKDSEFDAARSKANAELIQILAQYLTENPSIRFGQALVHLDIITNDATKPGHTNPFYTEPTEMLKHAKAALEVINNGK